MPVPEYVWAAWDGRILTVDTYSMYIVNVSTLLIAIIGRNILQTSS